MTLCNTLNGIDDWSTDEMAEFITYTAGGPMVSY